MIYPPHISDRAQSNLFTVQCCHWHSQTDIPPLPTLADHRVISSLFKVVIETHRQIYPPSLLSSKISLIARSTTMHIYIYIYNRRQIVVKNGNFTFLLTSSGVNNGKFTFLLTSSGQQCQFHISTDIWWSRMAILHFL